MVDSRITWPLHVIDLSEEGHSFVAVNLIELARYVEYWNCPDVVPGSDSWEIRDNDGRLLHGVIVHLQVKHLGFADDIGDTSKDAVDGP